MHSENELGYQTRSDGFGILYGEIAGALIERCGRNGMGIVRKAVAAYGKKKGKRLREQYMGSGVRTDLHNLMAAEDGCWKDPRTLKTTVRDTPEAQLWEIYSSFREKLERQGQRGSRAALLRGVSACSYGWIRRRGWPGECFKQQNVQER